MAQATDDLYQGVPVDPTVDNAKQPKAAAPVDPFAIAGMKATPTNATPVPTPPTPGGTSTAQDSLVSSGLKVDTTPTGGGGAPPVGAGLGSTLDNGMSKHDYGTTLGQPAPGFGSGPSIQPPTPSPVSTGPATVGGPGWSEAQLQQYFGSLNVPVSTAGTFDATGKVVVDPTKLAGLKTAGAADPLVASQLAKLQAGPQGPQYRDFSGSLTGKMGTDVNTEIGADSLELNRQQDIANGDASKNAASGGFYRTAAGKAATQLPGGYYDPSDVATTDNGQSVLNDALKRAGFASGGTTGAMTPGNGTPGSAIIDPATGAPRGTTPTRALTPGGPTDVSGPSSGIGARVPALGSPATETNSTSNGATPTRSPAQQLTDETNSYVTPQRQTTANNTDPLSGVTSIDPTNDLRSTVITNTPSARTTNLNDMVDQSASGLAGVDRLKLATDDFNSLSKAGEPAYAAAERSATQLAARNGQLGSGMLNTSYGDLAHQRELELDTLKQKLASEATTGSIADQFAKTNTLSGLAGQSTATDQTGTNDLRGERSYQNSQANDAFTKGLTQWEAEQQAKNTDFNQGLALLGLGDTGNPASTLEGAAAQSNPAGDINSIMALAKSLGLSGTTGGGGGGGTAAGTAGASATGNPELDALIESILKKGIPGVQTTGGSGNATTGVPGVQMTPSTPQIPMMTGPQVSTLPPADPTYQYPEAMP